MRSAPVRLLAAGLALLALTAACGGTSGSASPAGSAASTTATEAGRGADPGPGARFAPKGSLLYLRTPGAGPAWDALARVRARMPGLRSFDPADSVGNVMRLLSAADFAEGPAVMFRSLAGESAEMLISRRTVRGEDGSDAADSLFYSQVSDHSGLERWIESHSSRMGSDGDFVLYRGKGKWPGYSALSQTTWLWANSPGTLRRSIATARGKRPSLLADGQFTAALAGLDASGAAAVGYTRGDLAGELRGPWIPDDQPGGSLASVTDRLGLADTAFAVGGNDHGIWMRAAPNMLARGYHPGPAFTPSLVGHAPPHPAVYVGIEDGATQLPGFDRLLAPMLGGNAVDRRVVERYLGLLYDVTPSDLAAVGRGEQAWFLGQTNGAAFRPADPSRAAAVIAAVAARNPAHGFQSGRDGDIVWLHGPEPPGRTRVPGPSLTELVAHAGISHPVSWVAAVNIVGLGLAGVRSEDDPNRSPLPQDSVVGAVLSAAPGSGGRYELGIYIEIKGG